MLGALVLHRLNPAEIIDFLVYFLMIIINRFNVLILFLLFSFYFLILLSFFVQLNLS